MLRVVDVSMAIMRTILAVRGFRGRAAFIGFFEVLFWLIAAGTALKHLDSPLHIVGYAAGFAMGNYVGVWLEAKFAVGMNVVRVVFPAKPDPAGRTTGTSASQRLRDEGYAVTVIGGQGWEQPVDILNIVVPRKQVGHVMDVVHDVDARAFVTVEEVRAHRGGHLHSGGRKFPSVVNA